MRTETGYIKQLQKAGKTSDSVILPKKFLEKLEISKNTFLHISLENNKIIIEKINYESGEK